MANIERIEEHFKQMNAFTATPNAGMTRYTYSEEDIKTRTYLKEKMEAYGLDVKEDGLGNIFGKLEGTRKDAPSVLVGSHFDSVPHGGYFDGPGGVIAGLEVAALFQEKGIKPTYPLEVIAMVEEEGSRFGGGLMGSRGINGLLSKEDFAGLKDKDGKSVHEAMREAGLDPTLPLRREPKTMKAFLELHIEQGPVLEEKQIPIGIVDKIVGLTQIKVTVKGKAGHAGTIPMNHRRDALLTASQIISELPNLVKNESEGTVITTGKLNVYPNGANVIADRVEFTIDLRSGNETRIQEVKEKVEHLLRSHEKAGIQIESEQQMYMEPKELDTGVRTLLKEASDKLNISSLEMQSGTAHDTMVFSDDTKAGLIFIPSKDGISHHPDEWSSYKDIALGADILFETVKRLTEARES